MQNHRSCVQAVLTTLGCLAVLVSSQPAAAADKPKYATDIPQSITTPNGIETRLGTLKFTDGFPDDATVEKLYDNLDFQRGVQAFLTAMPAASLSAMRKGIRGVSTRRIVVSEERRKGTCEGRLRFRKRPS